MSVIMLVLIPLLALLPVAAVVALLSALARRPAPAPSEAAEAARRHAAGVNLAAWCTLAVVPPIAAFVAIPLFRATSGRALYPGVLTGLWPGLFGLLFLAVHAVGELTWPRPTGAVRRAALIPRRLSDVVPTWLRRTTWGWAGALTVALVAMGFTAAEGHQFSAVDANGLVTTASPYPGWTYGVPLLVAAALVVAATEGVLRLIARRPAVVDADPAYDAASRLLSAHRVLRGAQLVLALTLAGVLVFGGVAIHHTQELLGTSLWAAGLAVGLAGVVVALTPARPAVQSASGLPPVGFPPPATGPAPASAIPTAP